MKSAEMLSAEVKDSLLAGFIKQVQIQPESTAIIFENDKITYHEAAVRAAKLADKLKKSGLTPGARVAVSILPSIDMVTSVLGVLWAGGVYVPINPFQPLERRKKIYAKADINYCVTFEGSSALQVEECSNITVEELASAPEVSVEPYGAASDDSAYIIFTSGSTGTPKGVEIAHGGARNTIDEIVRRFELTSKDCAIGISALDFDLSVFDIFGMLSIGGRLAVVNETKRKEPSEWIRIIDEFGVTVWNTVPALFEMLMLSLEKDKQLDTFRLVLLSGDWVLPYLYTSFREHSKTGRFVALGGATEASIWSNAYEVDEIDSGWKSVPYGKALRDQKYRIDFENRDAEPGETGELWIGGKGLAKGYISEPELTAGAFVMYNGERWYKTGDYGYYLPDGNIIFAGRKDTQVKINGFRIELGEIENVLNKMPGIKNSVVLAKKDNNKSSLVAALVLKDDEASASDETAAASSNKLENIVKIKTPEDALVADFIGKVMKSADRNMIPEETKKIVELWDAFTENVEASDCGNTDFKAVLDTKIDLFGQIIRGEVPTISLLEDDKLSPTALMVNSNIGNIIDRLADKIAEKIKNTETAPGKKVALSVMAGRQGMILEKLLQKLGDFKDAVEIYFFESSDLMLREAAERLNGYDFSINYIKADDQSLSGDFAGMMDIVIAFNCVHQFANAADGLMWSKLLLKKSGNLYMVESGGFTSLGLISAAVIEQGFTKYDDERKFSRNPMFSFEEWKDKFSRTGYNIDFAESNSDENVSFFAVSKKDSGTEINAETIADYCESNLVVYMRPEQFCVANKFPLTANGKVDRKTIAQWFASEEKETGKPLSGETEEKLGEIWKELLKKDRCFADESFFEIGGDSLLAARMISAIKNCFGLDVSMKEVFDAQRLDAIAAIIDKYTEESDLEEGEL